MEALRQSGRIGVDLPCAIHEALMRGTGDAMGLRDEQVWIGGSPPLASSDTTIRHGPEETRVLVEGKSLIMSEYASTASKDKKFFFRAGQTRMGTGFLSAMRLSCLAICKKRLWAHRLIASAQENTPLCVKPKVQQSLQPQFKTLVMVIGIQQTLIIRGSRRQLLNQRICCLPH